jgi:glyoxylase I family protein
MSQAAKQRPSMGGFHHFGVTVTDVEASADWYQRVLGLERIPAKIPSVPSRSDLESWAQWLDNSAVPHSGVTDIDDPIKYSALVFRDPDNIQLEFIFMAA